jgi:hypothetical protein
MVLGIMMRGTTDRGTWQPHYQHVATALRAVLFDTTQESCHGALRRLACSEDRPGNNLAIYYLNSLRQTASSRKRAPFASTADLANNPQVLESILRRVAGISYT